MKQQVQEAVDFLRKSGVTEPRVGVILGTGLGNAFISSMSDTLVIPYSKIPNFPVATVEFHHGNLHYGKIGKNNVLTMQGRFHYYEGYSLQDVTLPVRVMKLLGVKYLFISNAAGNLNRAFKKGELMLIDDHINLQPDNPLRGPNVSEWGPRFPDMSAPYSGELNEKLTEAAAQHGIKLHKGVYACVAGPNLETRAEYRFLQRIGADAVGMSTVPEVIVANHMNLPCCGVSVLTDECDPDNLKPVDLPEIVAAANAAEPKLTKLFVDVITNL